MSTSTIDFATLRNQLNTTVLSDTLDSLGHPNQAMRPFVRPLDDSLVLFGRARTGHFMTTFSVAEGENPYEHEIALVDSLGPDEIIVLGCDGPTERIAPWGELLTVVAQKRGATGCVTDGLVRDIRQIREMKFPLFHGGIGPLDSRARGKMMHYDLPIECGGVRIHPGDFIFGDADGVIVIPQAIVGEAVEKALKKIRDEDATRAELAAGARLADVFSRRDVL